MALNAKQRAFVREYAIDRNATQAAIRAGYSQHTAKQIGSRLLTNVDVEAELAGIEQKHAERTEITLERITAMLEEDRELARTLKQSSAAVAATMGLAKVHGHIVDKQNLSGSLGTYEATKVANSERDPIPGVDAAARPANGRDQKALSH